MYLTRRQREVFNYINRFIRNNGFSPSLEEIAGGVGLSSLATVHKHLDNLQKKGLIKRHWNRGRSIEVVASFDFPNSIDLPLLGTVAAGKPIEAVEDNLSITVPQDMVGVRETFVLQVRGDSMIDEQIKNGDYVIVERRNTADNGNTVAAIINGTEATIKKYYAENGKVRLQPANEKMEPLILPAGQVEIRGVIIGLLRKYK